MKGLTPLEVLDAMGLTELAIAKIEHHDRGHPLTTWPEGCAPCLATARRIRALAVRPASGRYFNELD
jgi:hypothetical protein